MDLEQALEHLFKAQRISGLKASYRKDNPIEYQKVLEYVNGGPRPTGVVTEMGQGLLTVEDVRRGGVSAVAESAPSGMVG